MTVKEAKEYIIRHCNPDYPNGKTEWETAINMAIDALTAQKEKVMHYSDCTGCKHIPRFSHDEPCATCSRNYENKWEGEDNG